MLPTEIERRRTNSEAGHKGKETGPRIGPAAIAAVLTVTDRAGAPAILLVTGQATGREVVVQAAAPAHDRKAALVRGREAAPAHELAAVPGPAADLQPVRVASAIAPCHPAAVLAATAHLAAAVAADTAVGPHVRAAAAAVTAWVAVG